MTANHFARAAMATALAATGFLTVAGTASAAETEPTHSPQQGSTDVSDYNTEGFDSAEQPEQPYFDGGPVNSALETVYGFLGAPADGLLGRNLPIPND